MNFNDWLKTQGLRYDHEGNDGDIRWFYDGAPVVAGMNDDTGAYDAWRNEGSGDDAYRVGVGSNLEAQNMSGRIVGNRYYIGDDPNEIAGTQANWGRYGFVPSMMQTDENGFKYVDKTLGQTYSGKQFADSGTNRGDIMDMMPMILASVVSGMGISAAFGAVADSAAVASGLDAVTTGGAVTPFSTTPSYSALGDVFGDFFAEGVADAATGGLTQGAGELVSQAVSAFPADSAMPQGLLGEPAQMPYEPPASTLSDFNYTPPSNYGPPTAESMGLDPVTTADVANPFSTTPSTPSLEAPIEPPAQLQQVNAGQVQAPNVDVRMPTPDVQTPSIQSYATTPSANGSYTIDVPNASTPLSQVPFGTDLGGASSFMDSLRSVSQVPASSTSLLDRITNSLTSPQGISETLKIGGGLLSGAAALSLAKQKAEAEAAAQQQIAAANSARSSFGGVKLNLRPTGLLLRTPNIRRVGV